MTIEKQQGEQ